MSLSLRQGLFAALAIACLAPVLAQAADTHRRELSPAAPGAHSVNSPPSPAAAAQQQLQRLALEAALVDSSAFGQLRMLRKLDATAVPKHAGGESCQ